MINHEVPHQSFAEVATQIATYFDITDQTPLMSDTNKRYSYTQNASYAPSCPVTSNTTIIISPTADNMSDIYNGFIYAEMQIQPILSGTAPTTQNLAVTWIGFKDSMDAIEKYEILANGSTIYTQNFAQEESFITAAASVGAAKMTDIYSKVVHKNIWEQKYGEQCGAWVDWANLQSPYTIKLKIDLRRFLPLSNIKFLPAFAGKVELRIFFGTSGLVVSNRNPALAFGGNLQQYASYTTPVMTVEFVQLGDQILMPTSTTAPTVPSDPYDPEDVDASAGKVNCEERVITVARNFTVTLCETNINCFGLNQMVYDGLVQRYSQKVLTYPTQILQFNSMSGALNAVSSKSVLTVTPKFIDSIFLLFPRQAYHKTVFKNPLLNSFQLGCAGYGQFPSVAFGTTREPRLLEMVSNALNLNSDTNSFSEDVLNSLIQDDIPSSTSPVRIDGKYSDDRTNFLIGIPTETDNTFQQGQTSNTPVNYELSIRQNSTNPYKSTTVPPIMGMLIDATFNIMVNANGQPPIVTVGPVDITSPVMVK